MGKIERVQQDDGGRAAGVGTLTVRYFASVREGIGVSEERLTPPASAKTVGDFLDWLRTRGPAYAAALSADLAIRAAVDHMHASPDTPIAEAREIAFFPMMTGG